MVRKRIGELLVEQRAISHAQLEAALAAQRQTRQRLGATLVMQGVITEETLAQALSTALGIPEVDLTQIQPEWSAVHMLRARFCEQHDLFPYAMESARGRKQLLVAMSDPLNVPAVEEIEFTTGLKVAPRVAPLSQVRSCILRYYRKASPDAASDAGARSVTITQRGGVTLELATGNSAPVEESAPDEVEDIIVGEELPTGGNPLNEQQSLAELIERKAAARRNRKKNSRPSSPTTTDALNQDLAYLFGSNAEEDRVDALEQKFWALMRLMARKGLITKDEFTQELDDSEDTPDR